MADPPAGDEPTTAGRKRGTARKQRATKRRGRGRPATAGSGRSAGRTGRTGKRYSAPERERILSFLKDYNQQHGRGGLTAANKRFKVSIPTLSAWQKTAPAAAKRASGRRGRGTPSTAARARRDQSVRGGGGGDDQSLSGVLRRMAEIHSEIERLQQEFRELKNRI